MKLDKPSLVLAGLILLVALVFAVGGISEDAADKAFILLPVLGFAWARRQSCKSAGAA